MSIVKYLWMIMSVYDSYFFIGYYDELWYTKNLWTFMTDYEDKNNKKIRIDIYWLYSYASSYRGFNGHSRCRVDLCFNDPHKHGPL